jgi:hypothetical protein
MTIWSLKMTVLIKVRPYKTDHSLQFFGDHSTVTVGPDVRQVWVEPTPQLLDDGISNRAKATNEMP